MTSEAPHTQQRRRHYVDRPLQSALVAGLVIGQLALIAVCVWLLDIRLNAVLDAQIYRVHFGAPPTAEAYRAEALRLLAFFAAANLALVALVEILWAIHVGRLLERYRALLRRVRELDFTPDAYSPHPLLALTLQWRRTERERLLGIRRCLAALAAARDHAQRQRALLSELAALLPDPASQAEPVSTDSANRARQRSD